MSSLKNGIRAAKAGRMQEALAFFKDAIIEEPQNAEVWVWIAAIIDDLDKQEVFLKKALKIDPNNIRAQHGLAAVRKSRSVLSSNDLEPTRPIAPFPNSAKPAPQKPVSRRGGFDVGEEKEFGINQDQHKKKRVTNKNDTNRGDFGNKPKPSLLKTVLVGTLVALFCFLGIIAANYFFDIHLPFDFSSIDLFKKPPDQPEITIKSITGNTIDLIVRFPAQPIKSLSGDTEAVFDETIYDHPSDSGVPDLPVLYEEVEVPAGETVEIQIIDSKSYSQSLGEALLPGSIPDRLPDIEKCISEELCGSLSPVDQVQSTAIFPKEYVRLVSTYIVRGHQIAQLEFWPVQYDLENQTVEIYEEIRLRIVVSGVDQRSITQGSNVASPVFEELLSNSVLNYTPQTPTQSIHGLGGEGYLILAPDAFIPALAQLVDLKELQGYSVTLVGLSTTGTTAEEIKTYIQQAYENWPLPPTYVLLVGDVDNGALSLPTFIGYSSYSATDLYYGTVDGADWIPDIFVGRLPARSTDQLEIMIGNLVAYNDLTGEESWVKHAALLASDDPFYWTIAEGTQNYVIENGTSPAGYTGAFPSNPQAGGDKLYAYSYGAANSDVLNAIKLGQALIAFTGHGSSVSWGGPSLSQTDIRDISGNGILSVVTSFACYTGKFDSTESFGETWLLQANRGAVAFIGSSAASFWGGDDVFERAMMEALYSGTSSATVIGNFKFVGLLAVETTRPGTGTAQSRYYWETYNTLGDPALELLIGPKNSDFTLNVEPSTISVCVNESANALANVGQISSFNNPVSLSISGVPSEVGVNLSVNPVTPPNASQMIISPDRKAAAGDYVLVVSGTSGSHYHEYNLGLSVSSEPPASITMTNPINGATDVDVNSFFNWQETQTNLTYEIQVALDSDFIQTIYTETGLSQPSFLPPEPLNNSTTYFWRVRAVNACGISDYSPIFHFTTAAALGDCPVGTTATEIYRTDFSQTTGWSHHGSNDTWALSTSRAITPVFSFRSIDYNAISLQHLVSPVFSLHETNGQQVSLKFSQWLDIEQNSTGCFDGAVLEISNDDGQTWSQIPESLLLGSPYTGLISAYSGNPLGGSLGWCGFQDWAEVAVDLSEYAGQEVALRFTQGTDSSLGREGWYIDDFSLVACEAQMAYHPYLSVDTLSAVQSPGMDVNVRINLTNGGLNPDAYSIDLGDNKWNVNLKTDAAITLQPGETTTLEITVTVPLDAKIGDVEEVIISVTSQNDPGNPPASDQAIIELTAGIQLIFPIFFSP